MGLFQFYRMDIDFGKYGIVIRNTGDNISPLYFVRDVDDDQVQNAVVSSGIQFIVFFPET